MSDIPFKALTVLQFAKLLQGVDRDELRAMFTSPFELFIRGRGLGFQFLERKTIKGQVLTMAEMEGLEARGRVDAQAARAFLRLYAAGALPMVKGKLPQPATAVDRYIVDSAAAEAAAAAAEQDVRNRAEQTAAIRRGYMDLPATVPESAFTLSLLNDIFMRHHGKGGGPLEIGGITVTKTTPYRQDSNSGKSSDWTYNFSGRRQMSANRPFRGKADMPAIAGATRTAIGGSVGSDSGVVAASCRRDQSASKGALKAG